tara:strand:- start:253 stop:558 length:306 start_codon:yes stop_codon:yes gene_type:complete
MIEWIIIGVLVSFVVLLVLYVKNLLLTIRNIETMVFDVREISTQYKNLVETVNKSETYYGDPIIQELVEASNELSFRLGLIADIEQQLLGEEDDKEETQES